MTGAAARPPSAAAGSAGTDTDGARAARALRSLRFPWLTSAVGVVTAAVSVAGLVHDPLLDGLRRAPGEPGAGGWRLLTALLVHDSPAALATNLLLLAVVGTAAEQQRSRPSWAAAYVVGGLAGELAGVRWQPSGAGDSVAVLGLLGGVAVVAWLRRDPPLPGLRVGVGVPALLWGAIVLVALLAGTFAAGGTAALVVWAVAAVGAGVAVRVVGRGGGEHAGRVLALGVVVLGVALTARADIHGPALLAGVALAAATERGRRSPERAGAAPAPPP